MIAKQTGCFFTFDTEWFNFSIQDTGACLTIMHIRVYYKYCPQTTLNLAGYERINAGADSSPTAAQGRCVAHATQVKIKQNRLVDFLTQNPLFNHPESIS